MALRLILYKQGEHDAMFGKKQEFTRELEEKLNITQFQLEKLQTQIHSVLNLFSIYWSNHDFTHLFSRPCHLSLPSES